MFIVKSLTNPLHVELEPLCTDTDSVKMQKDDLSSFPDNKTDFLYFSVKYQA